MLGLKNWIYIGDGDEEMKSVNRIYTCKKI